MKRHVMSIISKLGTLMKKSAFGNLVDDILGKKEKKGQQEKEIVKLAQQRGGRLSILEIVAETSMNSAEADEMMAEMSRNGYVTMDVTEAGGIIYTFPGMAERFQLDNQQLFRQEIIRETAKPTPPPEPTPRRAELPPKPTREPLPPRPAKKPPVDFPLPPKPQVLQRVETNGLIFELHACARRGKNVVCEVRVNTAQHHRELGIRPGAKAFDAVAKEYLAQVQVAGGHQHTATNDAKGYIDYVWVSLVKGSAVNINLSFRFPVPRLKIVPLLELQCKNDMFGPVFTVQFQDIPLAS